MQLGERHETREAPPVQAGLAAGWSALLAEAFLLASTALLLLAVATRLAHAGPGSGFVFGVAVLLHGVATVRGFRRAADLLALPCPHCNEPYHRGADGSLRVGRGCGHCGTPLR